MSGGSYNYAYQHIDELSYTIDEQPSGPTAAPGYLRRAFKEHLRKVARACRAIEWNDSCDGDDDEEALIRECVGDSAALESAVANARAARAGLEHALARVGTKATLSVRAVAPCDECGGSGSAGDGAQCSACYGTGIRDGGSP